MNLKVMRAYIRPRPEGGEIVQLELAGLPVPVPGTFGTLTVEFITSPGQAEPFVRDHLAGVPCLVSAGDGSVRKVA